MLERDECVNCHFLESCFLKVNWESIGERDVLVRENQVVDGALDGGAHDSTGNEEKVKAGRDGKAITMFTSGVPGQIIYLVRQRLVSSNAAALQGHAESNSEWLIQVL